MGMERRVREGRKVFVSHATADNERCASLIAALQAWGVDHWFDTSPAEGGVDLSARIQQAIVACDTFIRVCTRASQQSYWVRLETSAFRGLQAQEAQDQARHGERAGRRILINLILDPAYQREPFDLAAIFIDATKQPLAGWLDELRRALRPGDSGEAAGTIGAGGSTPETQPFAGGAAAPSPRRPGGYTGISSPPMTPEQGASSFGAAPAPTGTRSSGLGRPRTVEPNRGQQPRRRRGPDRRVAIPLAVALALVVLLSGLLLARQTLGGSTAGRTQPSPTPTWTLIPTSIPTATLDLLPTATPAPPGYFQSSAAHFAFAASPNWGTPHDDLPCSACDGATVEFPGPPTDRNAYAVIELLTSQQWANASNDAVVDNADRWFTYQGGVTQQSREPATVGGASCVRGLFNANDNSFTGWLFGCHTGSREYMMYFRTSQSAWAAESSGGITGMINSIRWL